MAIRTVAVKDPVEVIKGTTRRYILSDYLWRLTSPLQRYLPYFILSHEEDRQLRFYTHFYSLKTALASTAPDRMAKIQTSFDAMVQTARAHRPMQGGFYRPREDLPKDPKVYDAAVMKILHDELGEETVRNMLHDLRLYSSGCQEGLTVGFFQQYSPRVNTAVRNLYGTPEEVEADFVACAASVEITDRDEIRKLLEGLQKEIQRQFEGLETEVQTCLDYFKTKLNQMIANPKEITLEKLQSLQKNGVYLMKGVAHPEQFCDFLQNLQKVYQQRKDYTSRVTELLMEMEIARSNMIHIAKLEEEHTFSAQEMKPFLVVTDHAESKLTGYQLLKLRIPKDIDERNRVYQAIVEAQKANEYLGSQSRNSTDHLKRWNEIYNKELPAAREEEFVSRPKAGAKPVLQPCREEIFKYRDLVPFLELNRHLAPGSHDSEERFRISGAVLRQLKVPADVASDHPVRRAIERAKGFDIHSELMGNLSATPVMLPELKLEGNKFPVLVSFEDKDFPEQMKASVRAQTETILRNACREQKQGVIGVATRVFRERARVQPEILQAKLDNVDPRVRESFLRKKPDMVERFAAGQQKLLEICEELQRSIL